MSEPLTVEQMPDWFKEHDVRLTQVEADVAELPEVKAELTFLRNLLMLRPYGVKLPRNAPRDPRVLKRPRQGGHL